MRKKKQNNSNNGLQKKYYQQSEIHDHIHYMKTSNTLKWWLLIKEKIYNILRWKLWKKEVILKDIQIFLLLSYSSKYRGLAIELESPKYEWEVNPQRLFWGHEKFKTSISNEYIYLIKEIT